MIKRALTFGTFDLLHYGHLRLLSRVADMADEVYVGLASDEIIVRNKGFAPVYDYAIRSEMLLHTRHVDNVIKHDGPVDSTGRVLIIRQKISFIERYGIQLVVMGSDWEGAYEFLRPYCEVRYLERTPGISTTQLRTLMNDLDC